MQEIAILEIKENPNNPRTISEDKFAKLCQSIKDFPEMLKIRPLVIDADNVVLGGNMRLKALLALNYTKVPVMRANALTEAQKKEFIIKDNVGFGEWEWDTLANEWDVANLTEWGLDIPAFVTNGGATEDDLEIPETIETDIVKGDLFEIGRHRLLCGDSANSGDLALLMNGKMVDLYLTDPPYSVNFTKKSKEVLKSKQYNEIKNDNLPVKETAEKIWKPVFTNAYDVANDDCSFYVTMPQGGDQMMMMMMESKWQVKHELIWVKEAPVFSMGRLDFDYKHEPIMYGWKKKHNFYAVGEFTKSVWEIPRTENKLHPTMKPVALIENCLKNSTKENDIVLDTFGGSGSTMIGCHQLNRVGHLMEIDEKYCQIIIDRMLKLDPSLVIKRNGEIYAKNSLKTA